MLTQFQAVDGERICTKVFVVVRAQARTFQLLVLMDRE
jgi:hypothetical protein